MADPLHRYLTAQRDLGGEELILEAPYTPPPRRAAMPSPTKARPAAPDVKRAPRREVPVTPASAEPPQARARAAPAIAAEDAIGWRKGAPMVPGPGLSITIPAAHPEWTSLEQIAGLIAACTGCPLCTGRTNTVPGEGDSRARLMLIGEGPGETEDRTGRPFVGRAGELLDKMLESIETPRATVFIANVVKCRPPRNRTPLPDERAACLPYLHRQIGLIQPKVLLALGSTAAEAMLGVKKTLGDLRLRVHEWNGIPLIVTYHPAALLRNPNWKRPAYDDIRIARQLLDLND